MLTTLQAAIVAVVAANAMRMDANESKYFAQELNHVMTKVYDLRFPAFKGRTLVPVNSEAGPGVEFITWKEYTPFGMAEVIANYANGLPRVQVKGDEQSAKVRTIGVAFGYSLEDVKKAQRAGRPLASAEASAARRAVEQKIDAVIFAGDAAHGLKGIANQANVSAGTVPNGAGGTATWATKTPMEILEDLHAAANGIVLATLEAEAPNTMAMPLAQYQLITTTRMSVDNPQTIAQAFLTSSPYITRLVPAAKLAAAGAGGTDRMVTYDASSDVLEMHIPEEFTQHNPHALSSLAWEIACTATLGGVTVYRPMAMAYHDGI